VKRVPVVKKTVAIHPTLDSGIRGIWALWIEMGYDAGYSTALNSMLLMAIFEATKPSGLSDETLKHVKDFLEDSSTIEKLNLHDLTTALKERLKRK